LPCFRALRMRRAPQEGALSACPQKLPPVQRFSSSILAWRGKIAGLKGRRLAAAPPKKTPGLFRTHNETRQAAGRPFSLYVPEYYTAPTAPGRLVMALHGGKRPMAAAFLWSWAARTRGSRGAILGRADGGPAIHLIKVPGTNGRKITDTPEPRSHSRFRPKAAGIIDGNKTAADRD